jgi:hypothetical protein
MPNHASSEESRDKQYPGTRPSDTRLRRHHSHILPMKYYFVTSSSTPHQHLDLLCLFVQIRCGLGALSVKLPLHAEYGRISKRSKVHSICSTFAHCSSKAVAHAGTWRADAEYKSESEAQQRSLPTHKVLLQVCKHRLPTDPTADGSPVRHGLYAGHNLLHGNHLPQQVGTTTLNHRSCAPTP